MAALVDTNILVYRFDPASARKHARAIELLRRGVADDSLRVPHQAVIEFVSVVTRPRQDKGPLLSKPEAYREAEELLAQFVILYPNEALVRGWRIRADRFCRHVCAPEIGSSQTCQKTARLRHPRCPEGTCRALTM